MTEAEWLGCADPQAMLEELRGKASDRKLRLFAVACCRRVWHRLTDERSRRAVDFAKGFADGQVTDDALLEAERAASLALADLAGEDARMFAVGVTMAAARQIPLHRLVIFATEPSGGTSELTDSPKCLLLRDIFGPLPFHTVAPDPRWLTWNHGTIPAIARRIYDERAFHDLPILADALEDAGCVNADILNHCRSDGPHVRGCWVVDLLLGKE
jgi:hypothetical protein